MMTRTEAQQRLAKLADEPDEGVRLSEAVATLESRLIELDETDLVGAFRKLDFRWA